MSTHVVIGTAPTVDTSVVVGPFRSIARALTASDELEQRGFVVEIAECQTVNEVPYADWSDEARS